MGSIKRRDRGRFQSENRQVRRLYPSFHEGGWGSHLRVRRVESHKPRLLHGGSRVPDPELHELTFPHSILECEYHRDSAGVGKWRGGYGTRFRIRFEDEGTSLSLQVGSGTEETAAFGLAGGRAAVPGTVSVRKASGEVVEIQEATLYRPGKGDVAEFHSSGGGGYGDPYERPVEAVAEDVMAGLLSVDQACHGYGVVVDPQTLAVDAEATERTRKGGIAV